MIQAKVFQSDVTRHLIFTDGSKRLLVLVRLNLLAVFGPVQCRLRNAFGPYLCLEFVIVVNCAVLWQFQEYGLLGYNIEIYLFELTGKKTV